MPIAKVDKVAYIATENTITIILDGQHRTVQVRNTAHKKEVITALERFKKSPQTEFDKDALEVYLAPIRRAVLASDNRFELSPNGKVLYLAGSKVPIPEQLGKHILDFLENRLPVDALVKFWESCLKNPHYIAVQELFNFLEENKLPITDDGGFLGYKKLNFVRGEERINVPDEFEELTLSEDGRVVSITGGIVIPSVAKKYKEFVAVGSNPLMVDVHSGTIQQRVGEVVKIERIRLASEERRQECGYGLHIGAFSYAFSGNVRVLCKVFPEDVIACNEGQAKLRTCAYQIVSFVKESKEVKEIFCDLQGKEADVAAGEYNDEYNDECDFIEGQVIICDEVDDDGTLTIGDAYTVLQADGSEVLIINDNGDEEWYDTNFFVDCEE